MALSKLKDKKKKKQISKPQFIKVNPYLESKDMALKLLADLSSAQNNDSSRNNFREVLKFIGEKNSEEVEDDEDLSFRDFLRNEGRIEVVYKIQERLNDLITIIDSNENTLNTVVAVGGGFSAGKSSFLNSISEKEDFLPTGIDPTSVIPTYLHCNVNEDEVIIAETVQKSLFEINEDILSVMGHQFQEKHEAKLASILDKIIIKLPVKKLDGLVFVDTPGYDKAENNSIVGKTDLETAKYEINKADVLFWLIDVEGGAVKETDKRFLNDFKGKKVIVFNKADKKPISDLEKIIKTAAKSLKIEEDKSVLDIIAYSSWDNNELYSYRKLGLDKIINSLKSDKGKQPTQKYIDFIKEEFSELDEYKNDEIKSTKGRLVEYEDWLINFNKNAKSFKKEEQSIENIVGGFNKSYDLIEEFKELFSGLNSLFLECSNRESKWKTKSGYFSSTNDLLTQASRTKLNGDKLNERYHEIKEEEYIFINDNDIDSLRKLIKNQKNTQKITRERIVKQIEEQKEELQILYSNKKTYQSFLKNLIHLYEKALVEIESKPINQNKISKIDNNKSVFDLIDDGKLEEFIKYFSIERQVDIANESGYTVLTYAVKTGQNDIVDFLVKNNVNLEKVDGRGKNAFETAVENQFRDICELLLNKKDDLYKYNKTNTLELAIEHESNFTKWISSITGDSLVVIEKAVDDSKSYILTKEDLEKSKLELEERNKKIYKISAQFDSKLEELLRVEFLNSEKDKKISGLIVLNSNNDFVISDLNSKIRELDERINDDLDKDKLITQVKKLSFIERFKVLF